MKQTLKGKVMEYHIEDMASTNAGCGIALLTMICTTMLLVSAAIWAYLKFCGS